MMKLTDLFDSTLFSHGEPVPSAQFISLTGLIAGQLLAKKKAERVDEVGWIKEFLAVRFIAIEAADFTVSEAGDVTLTSHRARRTSRIYSQFGKQLRFKHRIHRSFDAFL